jgi:hypothetical protein
MTEPTQENVKATLNRAMAAEWFIAGMLAAGGAVLIFSAKDPEPWVGFALLGLALFFYVLRGRVIGELTVGKDSITAKFQAQVQQAIDTAQEAKTNAEIAKGVAVAASPDAPPGELPDEPGAANLWKHPKFDRKKAPADDPQKYQWGENPRRNGRLLSATVERLDKTWFRIDAAVAATGDGKPLAPGTKVRFHIHNSFPRPVVIATAKNGVARISRVSFGSFTIGAEVANEPDTYLELDVAELPGVPDQFREN